MLSTYLLPSTIVSLASSQIVVRKGFGPENQLQTCAARFKQNYCHHARKCLHPVSRTWTTMGNKCPAVPRTLSPALSSATATDSFYDRGILYLGRHLLGRRHRIVVVVRKTLAWRAATIGAHIYDEKLCGKALPMWMIDNGEIGCLPPLPPHFLSWIGNICLIKSSTKSIQLTHLFR